MSPFDAASPAGSRWSVLVVDADSGDVVLEHGADDLLPSASLTKLHLLVEVAARVVDGALDPSLPLDRRAVAPVSDSGLWQHLATDVLPLGDVATLVGTVSDNLATNVLLDLVGLDAVRARSAALAPGGSALLDLVRDERGPEDPPRLGDACARDLASLFAVLHRGEVVDAEVSRLVLQWLAAGVDHSLVSSAFHLDPLAHAAPDLGLRVWTKTGADSGMRGEAGLVRGVTGRAVAFAALCTWTDPEDADERAAALAGLASVGAVVRGAALRPAPAAGHRRG